MAPGRYTERCFLDEATAIAAGHRPCYECRRRDYEAWREAFRDGNGLDGLPSAPEMDRRMHADRIDPASRAQRSEEHTSELQSLMRISYSVFCLKKKKKQKTQDSEVTNEKNTNRKPKNKKRIRKT